jgi:protein tyrosine/serine phosphatase
VRSNFVRTQRCATSLLVCSLLLVVLLAPAPGQEPKVDEPRVEELPNFARVNERLYRGAQPRKGGIRKLAALGVNTIINLRDDDQRAITEEEEAKAEGLRYFNVPFNRLGRPSDSQIDQVLSLIDGKENGVVFVHCRRGQDRTGIVIAVYRISHDEWTDYEATREAEQFGMKFWQVGMKDYISDYFRHRSPRANRSNTVSVDKKP